VRDPDARDRGALPHQTTTLPTPCSSLDLRPSGYYHRCSRCFFSALPPGSGPEGTGWPRSWGYKVGVYSIYKETRSSEEPGARDRHYAGWAADQDDAKRRADEIYEGRDSTEAVVVIGNGPTGVEVVYRLDGEN
jgi:hypothetical protein